MKDFFDSKVPICTNVSQVKELLNKYSDCNFCLYLAYKSEEDWDKSTSRVYMNKVSDKLIYLPINIEKEDYKSIEEVYVLSEATNQIVAINQTQPHKSNKVLREWFKDQDIPQNVDSLVKDQNGKLQLFDLNGPAFVGWFKDEVAGFNNKQIIVLGVGGVGEPIARKIILDNPEVMYLIDIVPKEELCKELSEYGKVDYYSSLNQLQLNKEEIIFINCAGKEGVDETGAIELLEEHDSKGNIFVDLRPHLNIDIVEKAKSLNWESYTGFGMNARTDYALLSKICEVSNIVPPSFDEFKKMVADAS